MIGGMGRGIVFGMVWVLMGIIEMGALRAEEEESFARFLGGGKLGALEEMAVEVTVRLVRPAAREEPGGTIFL